MSFQFLHVSTQLCSFHSHLLVIDPFVAVGQLDIASWTSSTGHLTPNSYRSPRNSPVTTSQARCDSLEFTPYELAHHRKAICTRAPSLQIFSSLCLLVEHLSQKFPLCWTAVRCVPLVSLESRTGIGYIELYILVCLFGCHLIYTPNATSLQLGAGQVLGAAVSTVVGWTWFRQVQ